MKRAIFCLIMVLGTLLSTLSAVEYRDVFISEDFSSGTFPPNGWTISSNAGNWSAFGSANAGGTQPELRLNWSPQFSGTSYFISPAVNTIGETEIYLDFKHFVDYYATPFTVGVATRSNGGAWHNVWTVSPTDDVGPDAVTVAINNADVGSAEFQFAVFFSGSSYNIDYWYVDDIKLYTPYPYDLAIISSDLPEHVDAGTEINHSCQVKNVGLNPLTALVGLAIYRGETLEAHYPSYYSEYLTPNQTETVTFPAFTPSLPNELYIFIYSVTPVENVNEGDVVNNDLYQTVNTWTGDKQMVMLEIGTGGWCPYCPGAAMAADDFIDQSYNVAVIENHNGDPYATDISNGRNDYYGISGYPTGIFDGVLSYVGGNNTTSVFPAYLPLYEQRNAVKTPLYIDIYGVQTRENFNLSLYFDVLAPIPYHNVAVHVAITESNISYSWQGQDHFNFVNRMMYPGLQGTPWDLTTAGVGLHTYEMNIEKGASWVYDNCELVVFIQNLDTKEIIQANKVALNALQPPPVATDDPSAPAANTQLGAVSPNPFADRVSIAYTVKDSAPVSIAVYNLKGQLVRNLVHDVKASGNYTANWDGKDLNGDKVANGAYLVKLSSGGTTSTRKVMVIK